MKWGVEEENEWSRQKKEENHISHSNTGHQPNSDSFKQHPATEKYEMSFKE